MCSAVPKALGKVNTANSAMGRKKSIVGSQRSIRYCFRSFSSFSNVDVHKMKEKAMNMTFCGAGWRSHISLGEAVTTTCDSWHFVQSILSFWSNHITAISWNRKSKIKRKQKQKQNQFNNWIYSHWFWTQRFHRGKVHEFKRFILTVRQTLYL